MILDFLSFCAINYNVCADISNSNNVKAALLQIP